MNYALTLLGRAVILLIGVIILIIGLTQCGSPETQEYQYPAPIERKVWKEAKHDAMYDCSTRYVFGTREQNLGMVDCVERMTQELYDERVAQ